MRVDIFKNKRVDVWAFVNIKRKYAYIDVLRKEGSKIATIARYRVLKNDPRIEKFGWRDFIVETLRKELTYSDDAFVQSMKELYPDFSWLEIVKTGTSRYLPA